MTAKSNIKKILVASLHAEYADTRRRVLEEAGFEVIAAPDIKSVENACKVGDFDLALIGYSLPASERRRVWGYLRNNCPGISIVQQHRPGEADLVEPNITFHEMVEPTDFVSTVLHLLRDETHS